MEERLLAEQARLVQVETRLEQIDQVGGLSDYEVVLKSIPELPVVSVRQVIAEQHQAETWSDQMRRKLIADLRRNGLRPSGQWMNIVHNAEYAEHHIDLQVAVIVDLTAFGASPSARKGIAFLPPAPHTACVVHTDPAWGLTGANAALYAWIQANGYSQSAPLREVCHADPEDDDAGCELIELQMPVERPSFPTANSIHRFNTRGTSNGTQICNKTCLYAGRHAVFWQEPAQGDQ